MISKARDPFTSLQRKEDNPAAVEAKSPSFPSLYISETELPLKDEDLNNVLTAQVKIKPTQIRTTIENGKTRYSYDFEVQGIRFNF
jgi:hypothetical protein